MSFVKLLKATPVTTVNCDSHNCESHIVESWWQLTFVGL